MHLSNKNCIIVSLYDQKECDFLTDMYIGRWLGLNEVVPLCAMEEVRLIVGITPLIFELGSRRMWVFKLSAQANLLPESKLKLEAG